MNKFLKGALCIGLCGTMLALTGCRNNDLDPETRPLRMATSALDENFNPFFYTAQNDGNMIALTQLPLLTNNEAGEIVCGPNEATVAFAKKEVYRDASGNVVTDGKIDGSTEYHIAIKKGIKYSDGHDLTINDVLFNLYVYLDPAYTGSATLYSTDIKGLNAYRKQNPNAADGTENSDIDSGFISQAQVRILDLIDWSLDPNEPEEPADTTMKKDLATTKAEFEKEALSDWNTVLAGWYESYKNDYHFTDGWQAYLFNEGLVSEQTKMDATTASQVRIYDDKNDNGKKDDGETYYTGFDAPQNSTGGDPAAKDYMDGVAAATTEAKVSAYMTQNNVDREVAIEYLQRDYCVSLVIANYTYKTNIAQVLSGWATGNTVLEAIVGEIREKYFEDAKDENGKLRVESISGITHYNTATTANEAYTSSDLGGDYDVLKIVINGIDPKAISNFSFSVAPLHYYSGTWAENGKNYVTAFNGTSEFGVELGSMKFFTEVLKETGKNGVPVGAGAYAASNNNGGIAASKGDFSHNNTVYFVRNDYFETVGPEITNAKIKYIQYRVTSDDMIMSALETGTIDYGEPSATAENMNRAKDNLSYANYLTGGYGYVGINPKYVPDIAVRRAIMKAMDTSSIIRNYYGSSLASTIYRPMTKTSWAYPNSVTTPYEKIAFTTNEREIEDLVKGAGYSKGSDGIYAKGTHKLKYTFTIAGSSSDHPAYKMFLDAANTLNSIGFDIKVATSPSALKDMTNGTLHVWAAAWSSSLDPDMYQVYHKDSKASSVNNWGYSEILNVNNSQFSYERGIVGQLSDLIVQARESLDNTPGGVRAQLYAQCLDLVMELAVELPTYQRNDLCIYNNKVLDRTTMTAKPSYTMGLIDKIWELNYLK